MISAHQTVHMNALQSYSHSGDGDGISKISRISVQICYLLGQYQFECSDMPKQDFSLQRGSNFGLMLVTTDSYVREQKSNFGLQRASSTH